jgi:hypothetical protein
MIDGILPAAGLATRMRGLPKFLLPSGLDYVTLIERHVSKMLQVCETVWIPTRPEQIMLLDSLKISQDRVVIIPMTTDTMTETVIRLTSISAALKFMMVMPDTYFAGEQPYSFLSESDAEISLACWSIRDEQKGKLGQVLLSTFPEGEVLDSQDKQSDCNYSHSWGAMSFQKAIISHATREMPHTGYIIPKLLESGVKVHGRVMDGKYYDCGTPAEYLDMLQKESRF